jgi:hypothetical protein
MAFSCNNNTSYAGALFVFTVIKAAFVGLHTIAFEWKSVNLTPLAASKSIFGVLIVVLP